MHSSANGTPGAEGGAGAGLTGDRATVEVGATASAEAARSVTTTTGVAGEADGVATPGAIEVGRYASPAMLVRLDSIRSLA